jgi:hypothetical protein
LYGTGVSEVAATGAPYRLELAAEVRAWHEIGGLVRRLTTDERLEPGYYRDPDWAVRDVAAHLGTWLAEADRQFHQMAAGTYVGHDVDVDGLNAALLQAMRDQPWDVVWSQANAARTMLLEAWMSLTVETAEAGWWIEKSGPVHYAEHLPRLRA